MEIKMALVNVLREYKFERSAETQVTKISLITYMYIKVAEIIQF